MVNYVGFHVKNFMLEEVRGPYQIMFKPFQFAQREYKIEDNEYTKIIHSHYIYELFSPIFLTYRNYIANGILKYDKIREEMKFNYVLYHLPKNLVMLKNVKDVFELLKKEYKHLLPFMLFEDTYFSAQDKLKEANKKPIDLYRYLFSYIKKYGTNLCLDTAHMFSNSLSISEMLILLQESYDMGILKVIHLNGNTRHQGTSDHHVEFFSNNNVIENYNKILEKLNTFNDLSLIIEIDYDSSIVEETKKALTNYKNLVCKW